LCALTQGGLDGAIHGANGPANPPRPSFDSFLLRPTTEKEERKAEAGRSLRSLRVDQGRHLPTAARANNRSCQQPREPVEGGVLWVCGV
ncbi:hypothetical protein JY404_22255, partial [Stenotrophomonas maltophilia]|nr:hypothetical protein [Stenotrophomonas maltophilia]